MNYITENVAFHRLVELERISPKEQALWHALMNIANSLGWQKTFTVANLTLQSKAVLTERDVRDARNRLLQRGIIVYKPRGGNRAPLYGMVKLTESPAGTSAGSSAGYYSGKPEGGSTGKPTTLDKENKTNQNNPSNLSRENFESFWKAYPRKVAKEAAWKAFQKHKPDDALLSTMLSALNVQKASEQWTKASGQFIPHATTWLNQKRWEDEANESVENVNWAVIT